MYEDPLLKVRNAINISPIFENQIGGAIPLFVERYMYQTREFSAPRRTVRRSHHLVRWQYRRRGRDGPIAQ